VAAPPRALRDPRWPSALAVVTALALYVTLPGRLIVGPSWVLPVFEALLLVPLLLASPYRHSAEEPWMRAASVAIIVLINVANIASLGLLCQQLLKGHTHSGVALFYSAISIWLTNVIVFGLWYWELDRGGPAARYRGEDIPPDFQFPQMTTPAVARPGWRPGFIDYMYVSLTNATAFSPTDTMPLSPWSKVLMAVESLVSLLTVAIVAARAVNILS